MRAESVEIILKGLALYRKRLYQDMQCEHAGIESDGNVHEAINQQYREYVAEVDLAEKELRGESECCKSR